MNEEELAELLRYSSPKELYVVTWYNKLIILCCPFEVKTLKTIGDLKKGQIVWVSKVKVTKELITVFIIDNSAYYYFYFEIIID